MPDFITPEEFDQLMRNRRIAQTPQPQVDLPPVQQQDLSSVYPQVEPAQPTARMQYEAFRQTEPPISAYHPSRLRQFMSVLGGIGAGIGTRSVKGGLDVGTSIKYGPFLSQERAFKQELGKKEDVMKSEEEGRKLGATLTEAEAKTGAERARAEAERARRLQLESQTRRFQPGSPEAEEYEKIVSIQQSGKGPLNKLYTVTTKDGQTHNGVRVIHNPVDQSLSYQLPDGSMLGSDMVSELGEEKTPVTEIQDFIESFRNTHGRIPNETEMQDYYAGKAGKIAEKTGKKDETKARTEEIQAKAGLEKAQTIEHGGLNPGDLARVQQMISDRPDQAPALLKSLTKPQQLSLIRSGVDLPLLSVDSQKRVRNANITLQHVDRIRQYLQDPDIQKELGAWAGRKEILNSKIGIDSGDPKIANLSAKTQEFISFLTYNRLWEATSTVGYRPSQRVIEVMASSAPRISETPGRIEGALRAEESSTNNVILGELGKLNTGKPAPAKEEKVTDLKEEK